MFCPLGGRAWEMPLVLLLIWFRLKGGGGVNLALTVDHSLLPKRGQFWPWLFLLVHVSAERNTAPLRGAGAPREPLRLLLQPCLPSVAMTTKQNNITLVLPPTLIRFPQPSLQKVAGKGFCSLC